MAGFNLKRIVWTAGGGLVFLLMIYAYLQHVALKSQEVALQNVELAYKHPRVLTRTQTVKVAGQVHIKTRIVKEGGREETIREETHGPVVEMTDFHRIAEPVFQPSRNQNRWLLGAATQPADYREKSAWDGYLGYSFGNRLDLAAGLTGDGRAKLLVMVRF